MTRRRDTQATDELGNAVSALEQAVELMEAASRHITRAAAEVESLSRFQYGMESEKGSLVSLTKVAVKVVEKRSEVGQFAHGIDQTRKAIESS